jgi:hypothetical protein
MKKILRFILIIVAFHAGNCLGQDTLCYHQTASPLVSNHYIFYKENKHLPSGTFDKIMHSDDGQQWAGHGLFTERHRKLILQPFKLVRTMYFIKGDSLFLNPEIHDTISIPKIIFVKRGENLLQYSRSKKGKMSHLRKKTLFVRDEKDIDNHSTK